MTCKKCSRGGITSRPDGIHELDACLFQLKQKLRNVTIEILECPVCGDVSIGWYRQENTEDITENEDDRNS